MITDSVHGPMFVGSHLIPGRRIQSTLMEKRIINRTIALSDVITGMVRETST